MLSLELIAASEAGRGHLQHTAQGLYALALA